MVSKGSILISEPYLGDIHFERTVVLVCEHNEQGTFGYIINKPTTLEISSLVSDIDGFDANVYSGGPVSQDSLHFIHRGKKRIEGDVEVTDNLYWGGNFDEMRTLIQRKEISPAEIRFFIGYSGWGEGQLEAEMENKSWILGNASAEQIFEETTEQLWRILLKNMGGKYKAISNYPVDPRLN